ncbi:sodium-dependent transporter [Pyrococcus yayanosii]|uniref:Uncharacterized protein n=1 Tax=Pyrococcus yayanosii (strain CH1 / JCM 16557) TaxID=529709 RepID=F8AEK8_PYRYC|nr:sodium-dependent transporter [Pyrococcus yayanosii]AEH24687.1 hypothetical protein PYCH_10040 [Pyrococcus yayanosii CH1]
MRKLNLYFAFIVIAYTVGIWTFTVTPKVLMLLGLKGAVLMLAFTLVAAAAIVLQISSINATKYRVHEYLVKVARFPSISIIMISFLLVVTAVIGHYTGEALAKALNTNIAIFGILSILLVALLLLMARGRTLQLIVIVSVLFVILAVLSAVFLHSKVDEVVVDRASRTYLTATFDAMKSFEAPLKLSSVVQVFLVSILSFGLGVGFYYVLGTFMPPDLDIKKVLAIVILLQVMLSLVAALVVAYSIAISHQAYSTAFKTRDPWEAQEIYEKYFLPLLKYRQSEDIKIIYSVEAIYLIPDVLRTTKLEGGEGIITFLMLSLFLAGFTTLLLLIEGGAQIAADVFQINRRNSIAVITALSSILTGLTAIPSIKVVLTTVVVIMIPVFAAVELLPVMRARGIWGASKGATAVLVAIFIALWLPAVITVARIREEAVMLGIALGLVLLVPLLFNGVLVKSGKR